ncbi:MAG: heme-binding protein [Pseudomonadota bacterium]
MVWLSVSLAGLVAVWTVASWVMIRGVEEAPYAVIEARNAFEIRAYPAIAIAETRVNGVGFDANGTAFRRLAGYIFGGNARDQKIAMTAPVFIGRDQAATEMSFVLPKTVSMDAAPAPKSADVKVVEQPPGRFAARRFSWFAGRERQAAEARELLDDLKAAGIEPAGTPIYAAYNPPMTIPFMKRHEMLVRLSD